MKLILSLIGFFIAVFVITLAIHAAILDFVHFGYDPLATYESRCYLVGMIFAHGGLSLIATLGVLAIFIELDTGR